MKCNKKCQYYKSGMCTEEYEQGNTYMPIVRENQACLYDKDKRQDDDK